MADSLRKQAFDNVLWKVLDSGGRQVIQLGISMVLARLIMPEQFGAVAMLSIFLAVSQTLIDSGFSSALIRKQDRTPLDCSTIFYFNIAMSMVLYVILYLGAPLVARFYEMPELTSLLRVTSLGIIIGAFSSVQVTLFNAELRFKVLTKYGIAALIISGLCGIWFAYKGYQAWALVYQSLISATLSTIFLWYASSWRPIRAFSMASLKEFFAFGSKLLASRLLDTVYNNIYGVVIGKIFKASDLAFYNRAYSIKALTSAMPTAVLQSVTYPTLCKVQDDEERLKRGYRQMIRLAGFTIFPMCLGAGAVSYPLINVLFSHVWIYAAVLLQIIVFAGMWYPIHAINLNLLIVKGRSDLFLRLEIIKKCIGVSILCMSAPFGLVAMCYSQIATTLLCLAVNTYYTKKLINFGMLDQIRDLAPFLILSGAMFVVCKMITTAMGDGFLSLVVGVTVGVVIYVGAAWLFRFPELNFLLKRGKP